MARGVNSGVIGFGLSAKVLKQSANNFFSGDVNLGRSPVRQNFSFLGKIFLFCKVSKSNNKIFCSRSLDFTVLNVPFHLCRRKSLNHVTDQSKQQTLAHGAATLRVSNTVQYGPFQVEPELNI